MHPAVISMQDTDFERLREVIYARSGVFFPERDRHALETRLSSRLEELDIESYKHYIAFLTTGPYQSEEFQELLDRIACNETTLFHDHTQLEVFEHITLPELIDARADTRQLRVWSAGCSTGEEPYSIAIMIHRVLGVRFPDWRIEILGSDLSERALRIAEEAAYAPRSFGGVDPAVKSRHFTEQDGLFHLHDDIHAMVTLETHNLKNTTAIKRHGTWDAIFCRDVLDRFDDEMKAGVAGMFYDQLADDGSLFIGHGETLRGLDVPFVPLEDRDAFAYTK